MENTIKKINQLKKEKNAVILAHIYQLPEIQDIADFVGDSLDLSRTAAKTDADIIVFCGVHFMAETAAILSPDKKVLIPDTGAGCPMADMITAEQLREFKKDHKDPVTVAYVNTTASLKTECDICCTSSNAVNVVNSIPEDKTIIFVPDRNLGDYVKKRSGRKMIVWDGYCPIHNDTMHKEQILEAKEAHPEAVVLVHPESAPEIIDLADHAMSTGQMCEYVLESSNKEFIIGTEVGIIYKLQKENPDKKFYSVSPQTLCVDMKKITLPKVLDVLENLSNQVIVPEDIRERAYLPIKRMLDIKN